MRVQLHSCGIRKGYIAFISVIVIAAIGSAVMISIIASGMDAMRTDFSIQQSGIARGMASSCAEEALERILESGITSGNGNLTIASGTCSYVITSSGGQNITISSTGVISTVVSKVKVIIATTTPSIILSSWEELADF